MGRLGAGSARIARENHVDSPAPADSDRRIDAKKPSASNPANIVSSTKPIGLYRRLVCELDFFYTRELDLNPHFLTLLFTSLGVHSPRFGEIRT